MYLIARVLLLVGVTFLFQACSENTVSPEDEIRQFVESGVSAAENRSLDDLSSLMHDSYLDQKGYNKKQLGSLLRAYFFRHKNIHLFTRIKTIELLAENQATVKLYVAMAGSVISDVDAIISLRARIYQFELRLIKDNDWLLQHATWSPSSIVDLQ